MNVNMNVPSIEKPPASDPAEGAIDPLIEEALRKLEIEAAESTGDPIRMARECLESTLRGLSLKPEEERALAREIDQLKALAQKLDENTVEIAAFGMVSRGKSSVLNALLGREVFRVGSTHGTTVNRSTHRWEVVSPEAVDPNPPKLVLIDTPGIDEVGGEFREALAAEIARHADLILFVVSSDMQRREFEALSQLRHARKPIILVFNQIDRYPDTDRDAIYAKIKDERVRLFLGPDDVVMTAARPDPVKVKIHHSDGSTQVLWERPPAVIEPLKKRILEILDREGKALVALNTLLFAGDVQDEIVAYKLRIRDESANQLIWRFSIAKGAAVALNPIPIVDMAGGLAVDVGMIVALSRVYGIPFTRMTATGLVRDMIKALGTLGVIEIVAKLVTSGLKSLLAGVSVASGGLAVPLTALGYGVIGVAQGAAAASTSYVLGQSAKVFLKQGCQWGPRGIKTVVHEILEQAKADSVLDRIRDELKRKLRTGV